MITTFDQLVAKVIEEALNQPEYAFDVEDAVWYASSFITEGDAEAIDSPYGYRLDDIALEARERFPLATSEDDEVTTWDDLDDMKVGTKPPTYETYEDTLKFFLRNLVVGEISLLTDLAEA